MEDGKRMLFVLVSLVSCVVNAQLRNDVTKDQRTYTIGYGNDWGAYEYFDEKGYIQGFSKELILAVCAAGNMDCYPIVVPYSQCWHSKPAEHPYGGRGLMDGWFDACTGWIQTVERMHVFNFGMPYLTSLTSYLYKLKGTTFDVTDLSNHKIGFIAGWYSDEKCLARGESSTRRNYVLSKDQIIYKDSTEQMLPLVEDGTVDAVFADITALEKFFDRFEEVKGSGIQCAISGNTMMARKGTTFLDDWNRGFRKLRSSGGFQKLCDQANRDHKKHGQINCAD